MPNTHLIADTAYELQATCQDLLPACVISTTFPTVPVSSMTLAAFATQAYVRDLEALVYVDQSAITVPLTGSDGTYWLAASRDVSTAYSGWTRRNGSHYMWRLSGTRPPDADGFLVFASCTVAGGVVTVVTTAPGVTRAEAWRSLSGLGTMAVQNANAVAITGGGATGLSTVGITAPQGNQWALSIANPTPGTLGGIYTEVADGTNRWNLHAFGTAPSYIRGRLGVGIEPSNARLTTLFQAGEYAHIYRPAVGGAANVVLFQSAASGTAGGIGQTDTTVSYNTSSDARLKHAITALTGALDVVQALRPVHFLWNANDEPGEGFLAHELMRHVPAAVTGEPDAVNEDGSVRPQQVDHSRLVPWLTACCQELAAQVQALAARVSTLEQQLGV